MLTHTHPVSSIPAAVLQVPIGSRVQLLMHDYDNCQRQQREELRNLVTQLGPAASSDPSQYGLLGYSCAEVPLDESQLVEEIWPKVGLSLIVHYWSLLCMLRVVVWRVEAI